MKNLFARMGGVLATLIFAASLSFFSCANSAGGSSDSGNSQGKQYSINYALGTPPDEDLRFDEEKFTPVEDSEGIYLEFDIPKNTFFTRVYIEGLGPVAEEVQHLNAEKTRGCFYYPFVEADKEYTIRFVFLRDEDRDKNNPDISFGHRDDDGVLGWFETKVKAGPQSKGEVRFTSKGQISVDKRGNFSFTKKPTFQNEDLLTENGNNWKVEIGLVEGISWEHGADRRTKWHTILSPIPSDKLTETINLYDSKYYDGGESSIDFICVRPIMHYTHTDDKTYKYQWDSFVQDIFYPPIEPNFINGIYLEYPVVTEEEYSRCDVTIDEIGKVAEMWEDSINFLDSNKSRASFFYPFVEPGKKYTVRFSFKKHENEDIEGFTIPTPDDTIIEYSYTVTVGAKSKGEVRPIFKGTVDAASTKQGNFKFTEKPKFQNEHLLGDDWMIELGLMEGISWEHGDERRTKWLDSVPIPNNKLDTETNLYEHVAKNDSIDCICVRPILLNYEYKGKKYSYQWDGFVHDIYYPLRNPDGIYLELDLPKQQFSRCDVTIDGIGRVSEMIYVDESTNKGYFFYPFVEPNKEYTVIFSFKKIENVDKEGFTIPTPDDTIKEVKMNVTAGPRAKGEVIPSDKWAMGVDSNYNIHTFEKFEAENERLFEGKWEVEIGLMEGISWDHGDERRTKWHCAVYIPNESIHGNSVNLRELCQKQHSDEQSHQANHEIDCICVRPIMRYTQDDKEYKYQWVGFTYDIHYPLNADFQEIDINNPDDIAKIQGTWTQNEEWDDTEYFPTKVHTIYNEMLVINDANVKRSYSFKYTKLNGNAFTKQEIIDGWCYYELTNEMLNSDSYFSYEIGDFQYEYEFPQDMEIPHYKYKFWILHHGSSLSSDYRTLTEKNDSEVPLSMYFGDWDDINDKGYTRYRELKLFKDGSELQVLTYGTDEDGYYEWTDVYKKQ